MTTALVCLVVAAASCGRAGPAGEANPPPLDGWFVLRSSQFRASADTSVAHGGRASARLEAVAGATGTGALTQVIPAAAYRGKRVRFAGFVRTDGVTGGAGLWLRVDRAGHAGSSWLAALDDTPDHELHGTTGWTRSEVVRDVAADAVGLMYGLQQSGAGTSHLDDATLEVVGDDVAVTRLDRRPRALQNPDFETGGDPPAGWELSGFGQDDVVVDLDRSDPEHGAASARIRTRVEHPRGVSALVQSLAAADYRGRRVRARAWLKGAEIGDARLVISVQAADDGPGADGVGGGTCALPPGTFAWRPCDVVFDVPALADAIEVGVTLKGRGTLWIDDVALTPVDLAVPVTATGEPRALANGDFERDDAELRPWVMAGGAQSHYEAARDLAVAHAGKASARLRPIVAAPLGYGVLIQAIAADDYRGQRIRVTAAVKTVDATGDLWVRVQGASSPSDGPGLSWASHPLTGTADWRTYELVVDVPPGGDSIQIGAGLRGHGTLWLDDVRLAPVGSDVALAPAPAAPRGLINGDFEADFEAALDGGWVMSGGASAEFEPAIDRTEHVSGAASLRLRPRVAAPSGYGTLMQSVPASAFRGKRLRMTAQVKGEGVEARGDLWLRVQAVYSPGDGPGLGGGACSLAHSFAWRPCELVFDVPDAAEEIQLGLGLAGPGTLWLDRVTLDEVPRDVPVTTVVRARTQPSNLDFEIITAPN
jgi:hypothetical protein